MTHESASVADARRRADQARAQLMATCDDILDYAHGLQQKLKPSHLAKDAWEATKSKSADIAEDAVDAVRKRPVAATGAVAAIALFIAREPLMDLATKLMSSKNPKKKSKGSKPAKQKVETSND